MYNFLIVGHGNFATGVKSALDLLIGGSNPIYAQNLNNDITHDTFEEIVTEYIRKYDKLIVFADLLGGAPNQIALRKIAEEQKSSEQYVVAGMSLGTILEICSQILLLGNTEDVGDLIQNSLNNSVESMSVMSLKDFQE